MRIIVTMLAALVLDAQVTVAPGDDRAEVALEAAIRAETIDGDLQSAIQQYEAVSRLGDRKAAAQALVRMARCYQKLGDAQALTVFERITREYPDQKDALAEARRNIPQDTPGDSIGWYNGDWCHCARGLRNQIIPDGRRALVYDDFVVPAGGWTITGVFSNNYMGQAEVAQAYWDIRKGMSAGKGGKLVASGTSPARLNRRTPVDPQGYAEYEVRVDGLILNLEPGQYWLAVAPVAAGLSYINATEGKNAVGNPPGNNRQGYFWFQDKRFAKTDAVSPGVHDSSQGVRIERKAN